MPISHPRHGLLGGALLLGLLVPTVALAADPAPSAPPAGDSDLSAESKEAGSTTATEEGGTGRTLQERIRAVSRRVFLKRQRFELEPQFGFTTNDALNRAWSFGARASYHFNEELSIDLGGGGGFNQQLEDIRVLTEVDLPKGAEQIAYGDVGVTFSPFYGKLAVMAEQVIHFDGFISGGLGVVVDNSGDAGAIAVNPAVELGVGTRVFLTRWLSLRGDLRNYAYPSFAGGQLTVPSALILSFGLGIFFPLDFDYSTEIIGAKG